MIGAFPVNPLPLLRPSPAPWDGDVMLLPTAVPAPGGDIYPSNTGIYVRGPKRGLLAAFPRGAVPNCDIATLAHFSASAIGWDR